MIFTSVLISALAATTMASPCRLSSHTSQAEVSSTETENHYTTPSPVHDTTSALSSGDVTISVPTPGYEIPVVSDDESSALTTPSGKSSDVDVTSTPILTTTETTAESTAVETSEVETTAKSSSVPESSSESTSESSAAETSAAETSAETSAETTSGTTSKTTTAQSTTSPTTTAQSTTLQTITSARSTTSTTTSSAAASSTTSATPQRPRAAKGTVPVGQLISSCTKPGVFALTFDDGPYEYTAQALDLLDAAGFKATFFLNGQNWGSIDDYGSVLERMVSEGHQIGSHTWNHADLTTLSASGIESNLLQLENKLIDMVGIQPNYIRLPYLASNADVLETLGDLAYKVIDIDVDSKDYELQDNPAQAIANFQAGLDAGGTISLAHDVHEVTVSTILPGMIAALQTKGLRSVTVGECLGESSSSWYPINP